MRAPQIGRIAYGRVTPSRRRDHERGRVVVVPGTYSLDWAAPGERAERYLYQRWSEGKVRRSRYLGKPAT
jgi:hypothetical protein